MFSFSRRESLDERTPDFTLPDAAAPARKLVSIVVPAYNEAGIISGNIDEIFRALRDFRCDFEIIVVDDGSRDATAAVAAATAGPYGGRVRVVTYTDNQGKGGALLCGTRYARGDYTVFLDADLELHPSQLPGLFARLERSGADVLVGSKQHPESTMRYPLLRRVYSVGYSSLVKLLFGLPVRDTQTGLKIFRTIVLQRVFAGVLVKRFAFDIEVLANAHRLGYRIVDGPVDLEYKRAAGRIKLADVKLMMRDTLAIAWRMHVLRYYDRLEHAMLAARPDAANSYELRLWPIARRAAVRTVRAAATAVAATAVTALQQPVELAA